MIKYFIGALVLAFSCQTWAIGKAQATVVFYDVYKTFTYKYKRIYVKFIVEDRYNNAAVYHCGKARLCIKTGKDFLRGVKNKHEWAAIVGHELAHYYLGHLNRRHKQSHEIQADKLGVRIANQAGFSGCLVKYFWLRRAYPGDEKAHKGDTHPAPSVRAKSLPC